jgi:biotin carboxyl carrier protein
MKYHITIDSQTYEVEILNLNTRPILVMVDGVTFEAWPENSNPNPAEQQTGGSFAESLITTPAPVVSGTAQPTSANVVRAPIPGTLVAIYVKPGDEVRYGDELFTLEAMKMRNAIRATRSGKIERLMVETGQTISHGDVLMEYEA